MMEENIAKMMVREILGLGLSPEIHIPINCPQSGPFINAFLLNNKDRTMRNIYLKN